MNFKLSASLVAAALLSAALPLAASAMTVGVSDEVDTTIMSGHLCQSSDSTSIHQGSEWSSLSSTKNGVETDGAGTQSSVVDPAASAAANGGQFNVSVSSNSGSNGTYQTISHNYSSLTGGAEAQTGITSTVSAFANP